MIHATSRTRNLTLAAALAAVAAILTALALGHHGGVAEAATPPTARLPQARVLVATTDLPMGTSVEQALQEKAIVLGSVAATSLQPAAIQSTAGLANAVLVQPVYEGQQLLAKQLGGATAAGLPSELKGRMRLIQVAGDANQLLAGTLQDGQTVDVVADWQKGTAGPVSGIVLRKVLVVHAATATSLSATLELSDAEAQKLFWVMKNGTWSLVLRPATNAGASAVAPTSAANLIKR